MKIITPKRLDANALRHYFAEIGLQFVVDASFSPWPSETDNWMDEPWPPVLSALYRLHQLVILNKRITVMEFGTGWSSLILAHALEENRKIYQDDVKRLRRNNPFEIAIVEAEENYLLISKERLKDQGLSNCSYLLSQVDMVTFNGRIMTQYKDLPFVNPDFIYLDGPGQFSPKGTVNGLSTAHKDFMPMAGDILLFEHFLTPGTVIVVDGRAANVRFLRHNLQRAWEYHYDEYSNQHSLQLIEDPLGKLNRKQIEHYSGIK